MILSAWAAPYLRPLIPSPTLWKAWRISFPIYYRTEGLGDQERRQQLADLVAQMSAALGVAPGRFANAAFSEPTLTTTTLSFVLLPNSSSDPEALLLRRLVLLQLQTPGSPLLRRTTLLSYVGPGPLSVRIDEVGTVRCGTPETETFVLPPNPCNSASSTVSLSATDSVPFLLRTYTIVFGTSLLTVVLAGACVALGYCLRQRLRKARLPPQAAAPGAVVAASATLPPAMISLVDARGIVRGSALLPAPPSSSYLSTSPYRLSMSPSPPSPRSPRRSMNRERIEKWQGENRVRFASIETTESD